MKITPAHNHIQLEIEEIKAGVLDTSSRESALEFAKVIAVAKDVKEFEVGDQVFVKAWAIDIINYQSKKYYFLDVDTKGIKAIVK